MTSLLSSLGQPPRFPTCSHARTGSARGRSYHSLLAAPPMVHGDGRLPFLPSTHPPRNSCRKSLKLDLLPSGGLLVKKGGGEGLAPQPRSPISGAVDLGCVPSTAPKRSSHYSSTWSSLPQSIPCQQGPLRGQGLGRGGQGCCGQAVPSHSSSSDSFFAGGFPSGFRVQQIHLPAPPGDPARSGQVRAGPLLFPPHLQLPGPVLPLGTAPPHIPRCPSLGGPQVSPQVLASCTATVIQLG